MERGDRFLSNRHFTSDHSDTGLQLANALFFVEQESSRLHAAFAYTEMSNVKHVCAAGQRVYSCNFPRRMFHSGRKFFDCAGQQSIL
jgi:hypothetical protein